MAWMDFKMNIFIVNGAPRCGKTSFESYVKLEGEKYNLIVSIYSTIDFVKEIARSCGWDGSKTLVNRKFLSDLKDLLTQWGDVPFKKTLEWLEELDVRLWERDINAKQSVVFIDCREPSEIRKLCAVTGAKSILIRRWEAENEETLNHADRDILDYNYDIVIDNNGDLEHLRQQVIKFIEKDLA